MSASSPASSPASDTQPTSPPGDAHARWAGGVFIVVWSTGYLAGAVAVSHGAPLTMLVLRFGLTALVFAALMRLNGLPWPKPADLKHGAVVGLLSLTLQFGGVYSALKMGASPGLSALVIGSMPLTVALMARALGERIGPRQWAGLVIGLAGVLLVIAHRLAHAQASLPACGALVLGLLGISAGTLYQKRHASNVDVRSGLFVQHAAAALLLLPPALVLEGFHLDLGWPLAGSLAWLVLVNSVGGFALLFLLIRRGAAHQVAALFYLVPPVTALMSRTLMHESMTLAEGAGFALAALGVWLASRPG